MKRGFTIVELLMVVGIIGVLLGLTVTAVTGSVKKARIQQADACVALVNQGAAAYYAMNSEWPGTFANKSDFTLKRINGEEQDYYELTAAEVRETILKLVQEARDGRPPMDISGLYVSLNDPGEKNGNHVFGTDFLSMIHGTKRNPKGNRDSSKMYFGYPEAEHGYFHRFWGYYYPKLDKLQFTKNEKTASNPDGD